METKFYIYGNILRVLRYNSNDVSKSVMIDVNTDDKSIVNVFDVSKRPYDSIFINSFVNILNQSTPRFKQTDNEDFKSLAKETISSNYSKVII